MLSVGEACLLGAMQGLTEFLPVSSSGHLVLLHQLVAPLPPAETAAVDVALHVGTLVALIAYFWRDVTAMLHAVLMGGGTWERRWAWLIVLATLPAAIVGFGWKHHIEHSFGSLAVVGLSFLVTGTLLWVASRVRPRHRPAADLGWADALVVGCFQAAALLPGVSRSGSTIAAGALRGFDRDVAARFAFLLGIPAIVGAEVGEAPRLAALGRGDVVALGAGMVVAAATGLLAISALMRLVRADRLHYFSYYLWPLGLIVLGVAVVEGV